MSLNRYKTMSETDRQNILTHTIQKSDKISPFKANIFDILMKLFFWLFKLIWIILVLVLKIVFRLIEFIFKIFFSVFLLIYFFLKSIVPSSDFNPLEDEKLKHF